MFCKNCGNQLAEGAAFCAVCGIPVNTEQNTDLPFDQPPVPTKKSKKVNKKVLGGVLGGICGAVLAFIIVVAASWQNIAHAAMGEVDYYLWREGATIADVLSTDALDGIMSWQNFSSKTEAEITIPDEEMNISVELDMSHERDEHKTVAVAEPVMTAEGESLSFGTYKIDYEDKVLAFSAKDITDAQIVIDFVNGIASGSLPEIGSDNSGIDLSDIDVKETAKLFGTIIKDAENDILKDSLTKGKQELDGKKYKTVELRIDGKTAAEFLKAVVEGIINDPEANKLFTEYLQMFLNTYTEFTYDDEISSADDLIDAMLYGLDDMAEYASDDELIYTVFYGSKDSIVNRRVEIPAEDFAMDIKTVTNKNGASLSVSSDYFTAELEKTEGSNGVSYSFDLTGEDYEDELNVSINATDLRVEACNGVNVILGSIDIYIYEGIDFELNASLNDDLYEISSSVPGVYELESSTTLNDKPDMSNFTEPDIKNGVSFEEFGARFEEDFEEYMYNSLY